MLRGLPLQVRWVGALSCSPALLAAVALGLAAVPEPVLGTETERPLHVGFGQAVITPPVPDAWTDRNGDGRRGAEEPWTDGNGNGRFDPVWMAGFHNGRPAAGVHDDLLAVAVIFDDGERRLGLVAADVVGLSHGFATALRDEVATELGLDGLLVHATHNHQGPDTQGLWGPGRFRSGVAAGSHERLRAQMAAALRRAHAAREPARLEAAELPGLAARAGLDDTRIPRVIDDDLRVLIARRSDGSVIGSIVNFGVHVELLWDRNVLLTADVAGATRAALQHGLVYDGEVWQPGLGGPSLWLTGNIGGLITTLPSTGVADPRDGALRTEPSFEKARAQGHVLARAVLDAVEARALAPVQSPRIGLYRQEMRVPIANPPLVFGALFGILDRDLQWGWGVSTTTEVGLMTIGDVWIAAIPGELYPEIAIGGIRSPKGADLAVAPVEVPPLREAMAGRVNFMVNLANDALGYLIPRSHWDAEAPWLGGATEETYGEIVSAGPDTAPLVHRALLDLFAEARAASAAPPPGPADPVPPGPADPGR